MATFTQFLGLQSGVPSATASGDTLNFTGYTTSGLSVDSISDGTGTLALDGSGNITTTSVVAIDIDGSGAVSINSSAGAVNIANDAVNQAVNIATAGTRTVTLGSATATVDVNSAGLTVDATTLSLDATGASNLTVTGADLTIGTATSGALTVESAGAFSAGDGVAQLEYDGTGVATIECLANTNTALTIQDTSGTPKTYLTVRTTTGQESVRFNEKAILMAQDGNTPLGQLITAGGTFSAGAPLAVNGTSGQYEAADANGTGTLNTVIGVAIGSGTAGNPTLMATHGIVTTTFDGTVATTDIGKFAYLSGTAGQASLTAPSASGDRVYKVGVVVQASGTTSAQISVQPQFLYDIP